MAHESTILFAASLLIATTLSTSSCKRQSAEVDGDAAVANCTSTSVQPKTGSDLITFYGDLAPILRSNRRGFVYKCTTCHAEYGDPQKISSVAELTRVVDSMKSGRMPRGGDPVPAPFLQLFGEWRIQGFAIGEVNQAPSRAGINAGVSKLTDTCK